TSANRYWMSDVLAYYLMQRRFFLQGKQVYLLIFLHIYRKNRGSLRQMTVFLHWKTAQEDPEQQPAVRPFLRWRAFPIMTINGPWRIRAICSALCVFMK